MHKLEYTTQKLLIKNILKYFFLHNLIQTGIQNFVIENEIAFSTWTVVMQL